MTEQSQVKYELFFCARVLLGNIRRIFLLKNLGYWNAYHYTDSVAYNIFLCFVLPCHAHIGSIRGPDCDHMLPENSHAHMHFCLLLIFSSIMMVSQFSLGCYLWLSINGDHFFIIIIIFYNCKTHMHEHSTMISYKLN